MTEELGKGVYGVVAHVEGRPEFVCKQIANQPSYIEYASTYRELDALYHLGQLEGYCRDSANTYIIMKKVEGKKFEAKPGDSVPMPVIDKVQKEITSVFYQGYDHLDAVRTVFVNGIHNKQLNPGNVLFSGDDNNSKVNLIDWASSIRSYQFTLFARMFQKS